MNFINLGKPNIQPNQRDEVLSLYNGFYGVNNWSLYSSKGEEYLIVKSNFKPKHDLYIITSNMKKFVSGIDMLNNLKINVGQFDFGISEDGFDVELIATHKAQVAYSVLCRPVLCEDSGFVIPDKDGWPGARVKRELGENGINLNKFNDIAKKFGGEVYSYWFMCLGYCDSMLDVPKLFSSKIEGYLIDKVLGDRTLDHVKSDISLSFIPQVLRDAGLEKTIAEMSSEEYKKYLTTNRWSELENYFKERIKTKIN